MSGSHQGQEHPHLNGLDNPGISVVPPTPSGRRPLFPGDSLRETQREGDLEKSGSASQRAPSPYTRSVTEAEKTQKEIDVVLGMLIQLEVARFSFTGDNDPADLVKNLATDATLRAHLVRLKSKKNILDWRALASKRSMFNLDPVVVERLLDIQRDSAAAVGALAVVGATLAYSTMYSATRGNMWYPFIAWWMFVISMATTSALSLAASGSSISGAGDLLETDDHAEDTSSNLSSPTTRNWIFQKLSVAIVGLSLTGVAGGWAVLAMGATGYSLNKELAGNNPAISEGPNLGNGIQLSSRLISYIIIGIFVIVLIGGYFYRLRPRFHALEYKSIFLSELN